ncbi:MAG: DUF3105 domain-containing protein [Nitriliruptorales bacterium]|nr:DUF3105 domain-containing protein [Nitriliruptorales bacterium]
MSKRERQKQRREAKLAQQRAAQARARRARLLTFVVLGAVLAALVGAYVVQQQNQRNREAARLASVQEKLDELGCTEVQNLEDAGAGHLDGQSLAQQPPEALYPDRPATSGQHFGNWLMTGVYDELMDERALVHNLEHGYVLGYYTDAAPEDHVTAFKEYAQEQIDGKFPKIIVSPWDGELPDQANFAYVAWNHRQMCDEFDEDVFGVFIEDHHSGAGDAPPAEKGISPHLEEGGGTIDPGDEPFLLPPLGSQAPPDEGMDDGATDGTGEPPS